jgi:hypothetical protein
MPHALAPTLAMVLLAANPQPTGSAPEGLPTSSAVVGGHHIQPRGGGSASDVPNNDAAEVDRLYQELTGMPPDAGRTPKPPAAPSRRP